ncbi:hypothetical protein DAPPUDRAFT_226042 [Daphnia pulex]|uniref:Uncharacterized protein n=1 Tax=Daphnia pulex TaxID=6669 RepID=E9GVQ2_DAPPU|nr:hypothetical protein DAPPUDRAFT_226042 [Daphnia pulex]|eukprot:EFX76484.1 hypothetical protein DAPPUDRAFT_226042 [Daphnia pulex]
MKSYSTLSLVFLAGFLLLVAVSGNKTTGNEDTSFLSSTIDVSNASETRPAAPVAATASEEDKKLLLPLLAMKPLVIAGGLLAGGKLNQKKPSMPSPAVAAARPTAANNNVLVVIDDNIQQQQLVEKSEGADDDEPRKLLIPMMAMKPLLLVSVLTGAKLVKLPAISPPKIGITITKHEYPEKFADDIMMSQHAISADSLPSKH